MKLQALSAAVLAPVFLFGPMTQDGGQVDLKAKLAEQGRQIEELRIELTETRDVLDMTVVYLKAQAAAAKALKSSLAEVEAQGFTAGINPRSRETLLRNWRSYLDDQQDGLPLGKPKPKAETEK